MRGRVIALLLLASSAGCVNFYTHVDTVTEGEAGSVVEESFDGIGDYLRDRQELHVLQMHGMGDHPADKDCGAGSLNLKLQERIASELGFVLDKASDAPPKDIRIGDTVGGTYATRRFHKDGKTLYFSCLTWGEASREVKLRMLGLDSERFTEVNANEQHRALLNSKAKRFVNQSFSDPVIYLGTFGSFLRNTVWRGLEAAGAAQGRARMARLNREGTSVEAAADFYRDVEMVVISDSLGSRVIFDVLCERQGCRDPDRIAKSLSETERKDMATAESISLSLRSLYMLANQLPLLELAFIEAPTEQRSLDDIIGNGGENVACFRPPLPSPLAGDGRTQVIAFTDANDALSYHLSPGFKQRCAGSLHIVNVTLPNAKPRWLFVYAHLPKAHSMGFKTNTRAVDFLVRGNHPLR